MGIWFMPFCAFFWCLGKVWHANQKVRANGSEFLFLTTKCLLRIIDVVLKLCFVQDLGILSKLASL